VQERVVHSTRHAAKEEGKVYEDDLHAARDENLQRVLRMSADEVSEALAEVRALLSESSIAYLQARGHDALEAGKPRLASETTKPANVTEEIDLSKIDTKEALDNAARRLPDFERQKLAWTGMFDEKEASPATRTTPLLPGEEALEKEVRSEYIERVE
jgi:DNA-directed RNA polymerase specialized sigma subunit